MADGGENFGQQVPPLCLYLKDVLTKYPEGGQILKELVQNADDAQATKVVFLYDKSEHPCDTLLFDTLREFQGQALYAYNDASFKEADWRNIQKPQQGGKMDDLVKVGRFGLGFISVYHLTDLPCILSDDHIAFLDPLEKHFGPGRPGRRWKLSSQLLDDCHDQFSPYTNYNELFECSETNFNNGKFEGTIFRFPLRKRTSELSKSVFDVDDRMHELFKSFERDAEISLLFLKHVKSISVYERDHSRERPRLIFRVHAQIHYEEGDMTSFLSKVAEKRDFKTVSSVRIEKQLGAEAVNTSKYITVNILKFHNTSEELKSLISDDDLKLLPWMGMSLRISSIEEQNGRLFCFLPLPQSEQSGLPVHVHGYFGLGDNRRSIKWPDQESLQDKEALWNQLLVTEVFPEVYTKLILTAIDKSVKATDTLQLTDVYKGWPCVHVVDKIHTKWKDGVRSFLQLLRDKAILYTNYNGGSWKRQSDVFVDPQNNPLLAKVFTQKRRPVAELPDHVIESLKWADIPYQEVSPSVVRDCIRGDPLRFLTREEKLELIEYVTSDTIFGLDNLCLLPLQNGNFTSFCRTASTVFIATSENPSALIPNGGAKFAASDLPLVLTSYQIPEYTQLRFFSQEDVASLLRELLPSTWRNGKDDTLPWTPGINNHPPREWLMEIWNWLMRINQTYLNKFFGIPLIPMEPMHSRIARLQEDKMICKEQQYHRLPVVPLTNNVCSFLESVGVVVLRHDLPSFIIDHPYLDSCIKPPTPEGLMTILEAASHKVNLPDRVKRMSRDGKEEIRSLLAQLRQITSGQKSILRQLPFFLASGGQYISANGCAAAIPDDYFQIPVRRVVKNTCLILLRDAISSEFALSLWVHKQSVEELLTENYLPAVADGSYNESDSLKIMTWVLERREFDDLVRDLKFLPTGSSKADNRLLKSSPSELFEPSETLQLLFRNSKVFPTEPYSYGRLLAFLKQVGLKDESHITSAEFLRCAMEVSTATQRGKADVERGSALLNHINFYPHLLFQDVTRNGITKPLHKYLVDLCWVPCEASPPADYPVSSGWAGSPHTLYKPKQVGLFESALLQGSVLPLMKLLDLRQELLSVFSWSKQLDPENYYKVDLVVQHLKNVASNFQTTQEMYAVSRTVSEIYKFLSEASDANVTEFIERHMNTSQPWVWHGSGFATPTKVALSIGKLGVSLVPYLHIVPDDVQKYNSFLVKHGVQETFPESALCTALQIVQQKHVKDDDVSKEFNKDDYDRDLNLVCNILRYIVSIGIDTHTQILVPCRAVRGREKHLIMSCASECFYVDEERLYKQLSDFDKPVIHEAISNDVAQNLGLNPLSHFIAPVDPINYDIAGPHETTINAIKHNLDMYKEGVDIFKELIQNADDAGATEVKFLLDWRRNENTSSDLLSKGMEACHGPALWAYNNKCFSDDDIQNICNIASQGKKCQLDKIGRFGLGFTSVYHLTDVPSVVSGPYVLICDPRTTHLGSRINPGQPGIKLDLRKPDHRRTLESYPNQFQPYNSIFGCNLQESTNFDHTLFRLPLRTHMEAGGHQPNQLSDCVYDSKEKGENMIKSLKEAAATLLLFTQNVVHVSFHELQSGECVNDMKDVMSITLSRILQMPRSISGQTADTRTERNLLKATQARLKDKDHRLSGLETTMIVKVTQETYASVTCIGKKIKPKKNMKKDSHFIISSCMSTDQHMLELVYSPEGCKAGILPCGGVAAQLVYEKGGLTPQSGDGSEGKAFSYLPLGVSTGLPFHVNGSFILQPNRRQLWSKSSSGTGEFETSWNICFMKSVLCQALLNLLQDLSDLQDQKFQTEMIDARNFQTLWPRRSKCESDFYPLVDAYYCKIGSEDEAPLVMFNQTQWVSVHDCFFTDWNLTDPMALRDSIISLLLTRHQQAATTKNRVPKRWVELDPDVVDSIDKARAKKCFDENTFSVQRFLENVFFPMLEDVEVCVESKHRNEIVLHMLDLRLGERKVTNYDSTLQTTDCIPTSPSGEELASPNDLINPCTFIGCLYSEEDGRFPHGDEYRKKDRLLSLTQLGMWSEDLSWDDVCERTESVSMTAEKCKMLLKLIDQKLRKSDNPTPDQQNRIKEASFLPVLQRPQSFEYQWYRCEHLFMSANELYESSHEYLLGSVQPLLDEETLGTEALSQKVKSFLGFHGKQIAVCDVVQQLAILTEHEVTQLTPSIVFKIYTFLQETVCTESRGEELEVKKEYRATVDQLSALRFVWCDEQFRECRQLAFQYSGNNGPYLYRVPKVLSRFGDLLKLCGVRDHFEVGDFLHILKLLHDKYQDEPLQEADLIIANAMVSDTVSKLESIHDEGQGNNLEDDRVFIPDKDCILRRPSGVFIPDMDCILRRPSEITYNDMPWECTRENMVYTHQDITVNAAKILGIITERQKQLESCSSFRGFGMEFGQREELTDRLKNILASYPVSDVFKELLQNADDAGCTEIHFVYDLRSHPTEKVISESWAAVQQCPSLCVFNDKPFTEADIEGIQKVGVGGKRDDITTTGKFGIGFNAVYHWTDCPSFLSNSDILCVFDPLLKFVPGTNKSSPGRRFEAGEEFKEKFPDMLRGYLEDVKDFCGKEGTMFRFPLRTEPSVISEEVYDSSKMKTLLDDFKRVSREALFFLNSIETITVSSIGEKNILETKYSITALLSEEDQKCRVQLAEHLKAFKDNRCGTVEPMSHVYSLITMDSEKTKQSWLISQMLGIEDGPSCPDLPKGFKRSLPRGGVAAPIRERRLRESFPQKYSAYCFLPLPINTNLPVHVNGTFELDAARKNLSKGEGFENLDRSAEDYLIHGWNRLLVQNVIAPAYARLLQHAGSKILENMDGSTLPFEDRMGLYDDLFPKNLELLRGEWLLLAKATLCYVGQKNLKVLPVVHPQQNGETITWHHPNSDTSLAFFDNLCQRDKPKPSVESAKSRVAESGGARKLGKKGKVVKTDSIVLRSFLLDVGFNLLASSEELCLAFQTCDVEAKFVTPQVVVQHLKSASELAQSLPSPLEKTMLKDIHTLCVLFEYCLDGIEDPIELNGLPIRLTNDNMLREFSTTDGSYVTQHHKVLPCLKEKFLHKKLCASCTAWIKKNKTSEEAYSSGVFKQFTIFELAQHLGKQLPENWQGCDHHVEWTPDKDGHPSQSWLRDLWAFLCSESSGEKSQSSLEAINSWPIFPTTCGKLAPPSLSKTLLFLHSFCDTENRAKLAVALRKLGLPEVSWKHMLKQKDNVHVAHEPQGLKQLLKQYLALPTTQEDVTNVVQFVLQTDGVIGDLSLDQSDTLLQYFQEDEKLSEKSIQVIKRLAVFVLQDQEKTTDLQHYQHYHTTQGYSIPQVEAQKWMDHMKCVFLKPRPGLSMIYEQLGITPITQADIYLEYILPSFHRLTQAAQMEHIKFISKLSHASEEKQNAFQKDLSHVDFIPDHRGKLQRADYFFDTDNAVFNAMVHPNKLLPESMAWNESYGVWSFLQQIGLHTVVSQDEFIRFAKEVETRANQVLDSDEQKKLFDSSKLLSEELQTNETLLETSFLLGIAKIKFIPSVPIKPELLEIYPAFSESDSQPRHRAPFIAYQASVPKKHLKLVWSVSMLLPYWAIPPYSTWKRNVKVKIHECLGIQKETIMDKVLSHTQNVCGQMEKKNAIDKEDTLNTKVREMAKDVMMKILGYMKEHVNDYQKEIKNRLQYTPICLVEGGRVFVRANQIVFNMDRDQLRPYLYKAPRELAQFDEVLRLLGAEESCTFDQLAGVLSAMNKNCGDQRLGPNERKIATNAVAAIFVLLLQHKGKCKMSVGELYLPSSKFVLRKASELCYADPNLMGQQKLVSTDKEFILPLKQCGLGNEDEMKLIQLLPAELRPKNLGEDMVEKPCDTNVDCPAGNNCEYLEHIKRMVNSEEMTRVLLRLVQNQKNKQPDAAIIQRIKRLQDFSSFFCKRELKLGYFDTEGIMILEQKASRKAFQDIRTGMMHLEHSWPLGRHMSINFRQIAKCCNTLMDDLLDSEHEGNLLNALDCPSPNEMNTALTALNIPEYDTTTQAVQPDEHRPGTTIPLDIRHLLDPDPYNRFYEGEIVGFERSLDDGNVEALLPPVDDRAALGIGEWIPSESAASNEATEIMYAIIVERMDQDKEPINLSRRYRIDIGLNEPITVTGTALYKFLRPKQQSDSTVAIFTGEISTGAPSDESFPKNLQEIKEQIKRELEEVFKLPREGKNMVVHRLYLKWHPDKNPENQELANEAFKFLIQELNKCGAANQYSQQYSDWESEVRRDKEKARQYQERYHRSQSSARARTSSRNFVPPSFTRDAPDPRTARLWFRQAKEHFDSAKRTSQLGHAPIEWIAFQVHQAAETALKAAQYNIDGHPDISSNDLISLARTVCQHWNVSDRVLGIACELVRLDCQFSKPRYPQVHSSQTCRQVYHDFHTEKALKICEELLTCVQDIIGIKVF